MKSQRQQGPGTVSLFLRTVLRAVTSRELGIEEILCRGFGLQGGLKDTAGLGWAYMRNVGRPKAWNWELAEYSLLALGQTF